MPESRVVVKERALKYSGYFVISELYYVLDNLLNRLGYDKHEDVHDVRVYKTHRDINVVMKPDKGYSDYIKHKIKIKLSFANITDVTVELDGRKRQVQSGEITCKFEGTQDTNQGKYWNLGKNKPIGYFIQTLIDAFIYPDFIENTGKKLGKDIDALMDELSSHLNMNKFRLHEQTKIN